MKGLVRRKKHGVGMRKRWRLDEQQNGKQRSGKQQKGSSKCGSSSRKNGSSSAKRHCSGRGMRRRSGGGVRKRVKTQCDCNSRSCCTKPSGVDKRR